MALFLKHLLIKNVSLQGGSDHGFSEALYFADLDGNGIEVYADKPEDEWLYEDDGSIKGITTYMDIDSLVELMGEETFKELPADTLIGHIHVNNLEAADKFYIDGLNLNLTMKYGSQASFYSFGGYHHHIAVNTWNGVKAERPLALRGGLKSFTIRFYEQEELKKVVSQLNDLGFAVTKEEIYYLTKDPFGNFVKLYTE